MISFIHPYPAIQSSNLLKRTNQAGNVPTQMSYTLQEIDRQTTLFKHPEIMEGEENFPAQIKMDHNEIARRLLDKIT